MWPHDADMRCIAFILALALTACEKGGECVETWTQLEFATTLADGTSAESAMAALGGEFTGTLQWRSSDDVTLHPAMGATELTLALTYEGGEVWLVDREAQDLAPNERLACSDDLVIHARLGLTTSDGALAGSWDVEARHVIGEGATLGVDVRPFGVGNAGDFSAALAQPDEWDEGSEELALHATFYEAMVSGELVLSAERSLPAEGKIGNGAGLTATLATWTASP